jgi:hypothetical protein
MRAFMDVEFNLLENGLDSIAVGVRHISQASSKSDVKHGVLNVYGGIELLLKQRLVEEDWKLIFSRPEKASESHFATGQFHSVGLEDAIDRLEEHCDVFFEDEEKQTFISLKNMRNRLQHFQIKDSQQAIVGVVANALGIILTFVEGQISASAEGEEDLLTEIKERVKEFDAFVSARRKEVERAVKELWGRTNLLNCPVCDQEEFLLPDADVKCYFCGYRASATEAAKARIDNFFSYYPDEDSEYPLYDCPNCENHALVGEGEELEDYVCYACGEKFEMGELTLCWDCGQPSDSEDIFGGRCRDCFNAYVRRDNT